MLSSLVAATFDRCVLPLFVPDGNRPERLGSCLLVQLFGIHFVVTAAHVLRGSEGSPLFAGRTGHKLIALPGLRGYFPNDEGTEHLDIGVIPLGTSELARFDGLMFVPETSVENEVPQQPSPTDDYIVFGYPESNSQFRVDQPLRNVRQNSFTFRTALTTGHIANQEKLDPEAQLALQFDRENITINGKRHNPPDPYGLSGGAVFHAVAGQLKLAGIMTDTGRTPACWSAHG